MRGGLSHPVTMSHADVSPHVTSPSAAPIRELPELKRRRTEPGLAPAVPWRSGPALAACNEKTLSYSGALD